MVCLWVWENFTHGKSTATTTAAAAAAPVVGRMMRMSLSMQNVIYAVAHCGLMGI